MKVLAIGYGRHLFKAGNTERQRLESCAEAVGSLEMIVFTKKSDGLSVIQSAYGLNLYPTNSVSKITMIFDAIKIGSRLIRTEPRAYLVTTQDPFETGLIGWYLKLCFKLPLIIQMHADIYSTDYWQNESFLNHIRCALGKFLLKRSDSIRVVSSRIKKSLLKQSIPATKITQLPVAVEIDHFVSAMPSPIVKELFSEESFIFLSVGRFVIEKNYFLLLKAFNQVYASNPNARLLLVGEGPLKDEIVSFISASFPLGIVQILPWSDDVPGLMKAVDAYVLSSNYEGWARVLIEALGARLPIITTDVGCAGEVIIDGDHGLVVPVNDVGALAAAMIILSTNQSFYNQCFETISAIDPHTLPGANLKTYGQQWAVSLHTS